MKARLATALCMWSACAHAQTFVEVSAAAGITYQQRAAPFAVNQPPAAAEKATGGAAAGDYDGDGWVDLVVTRVDASPLLFRNQRDGTFTDVTASAGALASAVPVGSNGVLWADLDNDGDLDLYVTAVGPTRFFLFLNQGDGTFTEEAPARGAAVASDYAHYGMGVAAGDYDRDGWLDLFVTEWRAHAAPPTAPLPGPSQNRLLRNRGAEAPGHFVDVTVAAGVEVATLPDVPTSVLGDPGFSPGFVDLDDDGWPDLIWVADWGNSRLFWNDGRGGFRDGTAAAGVGLERSGMGSVQQDFDGDGRLDWMTTSIFGRQSEIIFGVSNQLYHYEGGRRFTNVTAGAGIADGGFGWGLSAFDFDNDADLDLLQTNGFMESGHDEYENWLHDRTRLFQNGGAGTFAEVGIAHGIVDAQLGRAAITFDYDHDGDLDALIVNHGGTPALYRNDGGNGHHWLQIVLAGRGSNRDAIGTLVTIDPDPATAGDEQTRLLTGNPGFLGHDERLVHFGLGASASPVAMIRVRWPSGAVQTLEGVPVDARVQIVEASVGLQVGFATVVSAAAEGAAPAEIVLQVAGMDTRGEAPRTIQLALTGTATAGVDYAGPTTVEVTIPPADYRTPGTLAVPLAILDDDEAEVDETIVFKLQPPTPQLGIAIATHTHTILSDDPVCGPPRHARLRIRHDGATEQFDWTIRTADYPPLGDPQSTTDYRLVLRDGNGLATSFDLTAAARRWRKTRSAGLRWSDRFGVRTPVRGVHIRTGKKPSAGSVVRLVGRGAARFGRPPMALPITVTLANAAGGCWRAKFPAARRNDARRLQALLDVP